MLPGSWTSEGRKEGMPTALHTGTAARLPSAIPTATVVDGPWQIYDGRARFAAFVTGISTANDAFTYTEVYQWGPGAGAPPRWLSPANPVWRIDVLGAAPAFHPNPAHTYARVENTTKAPGSVYPPPAIHPLTQGAPDTSPSVGVNFHAVGWYTVESYDGDDILRGGAWLEVAYAGNNAWRETFHYPARLQRPFYKSSGERIYWKIAWSDTPPPPFPNWAGWTCNAVLVPPPDPAPHAEAKGVE